VIFEIYCKMIIGHLGTSKIGFSNFNSILTSCEHNVSIVSNLEVSLVKRQANLVAHKLARASRLHAGTHDYQCIPQHVFSSIIDEMK